ncbi:uncharacterized protein LOC129894680 [Solanum dulcamara]|uniref:uncharacterized protein LOC129894680 n=1 Tax=Solanum dulcamara TaxID=45834 RepID=UPI0024869701|nr:uncharacterized protein LOC129894680 [Solanum dulcamara]
MARCYNLASTANVLQYQHQTMKIAFQMLESLKDIFKEKNHAAKKTPMKALLITKMDEESSIREHVLKMMSYLNELEIHGATIDNEYQKLLNELTVEESIIKQQALSVAFMVDKPIASSSKPVKAQKKKKKIC